MGDAKKHLAHVGLELLPAQKKRNPEEGRRKIPEYAKRAEEKKEGAR